jgi:hypothetical protein
MSSSKSSGNKTRASEASVEDFINSVDDEQKRADSWDMIALMERITGHPARMWGSSMVGFGTYHYRYESGREGDFFLTGFSPRKTAFTVYIMPGFSNYDELMSRLGPYKTGKSCLYLKNLQVVDRDVLEELIADSVAFMKDKYDVE